MIWSLNENRKPTNEKFFFKESLVMFDKSLMNQLKVKTRERKLRLVWDKILVAIKK